MEAERKKERVQVVLDFSALKDAMLKGGLTLQKTKCPECGASITLPTTGNQIKCEYCGSTIYAQDIFEKIKSLI
jgi:ribosomal protein S27AE